MSNEELKQLLEDVQKLKEMHQETTHVHEKDLLEKAYELILKVYTSGDGGLTFIPGLTYDLSNWLQWYRRLKKVGKDE